MKRLYDNTRADYTFQKILLPVGSYLTFHVILSVNCLSSHFSSSSSSSSHLLILSSLAVQQMLPMRFSTLQPRHQQKPTHSPASLSGSPSALSSVP